jgi:hypothetical protein
VRRSPVEVTDEPIAGMKKHFNDEQLVEITALLTLVNLDRFQRRLRDRHGRVQRRNDLRAAGPPRRRPRTGEDGLEKRPSSRARLGSTLFSSRRRFKARVVGSPV